jgi:hypothetical protein
MCRFLFVGLILPAIKSPQLYDVVRDAPKKEAQKTLDFIERIMGYIADAATGEAPKVQRPAYECTCARLCAAIKP